MTEPAETNITFQKSILVSLLVSYWIYNYFFDYKVQNHGNRRSPWVCSWYIWKWIGSLFPAKLFVKNSEIFTPNQSYLFAVHPHGALSFGALSTFIPEGFGMRESVPQVDCRLCTLQLAFCIPLLRELILYLGFVDVSKRTLKYLASHVVNGHALSAMVVVGGAEESLYAYPGSTDVVLKKRKGFIKQALMNNMEVVPVYLFGETELYEQIRYPWLTKLQRVIQRLLSFATPVLIGKYYTVLPRFRPINVVVGTPLHIPRFDESETFQQKVDAYHKMYMVSLKNLFRENVQQYGTEAEKRKGELVFVK